MEDKVAALYGRRERSRIADIAGYAFDIELVKFTGRPAKGTNPVTSFGEQASDVPAYKSTGAGD